MQLSSSLSGAPVSVSASVSASGAAIGTGTRKLNATIQRVPDFGVVVELSPEAEAFLERSSSGSQDAPSGNPLAPVGLSDVMADVELVGPSNESDLPGVFQVYENPAFEEAEDAREAARAAPESPEVEGEKNPGELSQDERVVVDKLKARDAAVRAHEMAHVAAAGGLAGAPVFSYQTGPDGQRYAIGGSVSIDTSPERSPEETVAKAQRIRSAALAPADPSAADRAVASRASRMEQQARQAMAQNQARESQEVMARVSESMEDTSTDTEVSEDGSVVEAPSAPRSRSLDLPRRSVSSVIPGGIATLASERRPVANASVGPSTLRSESRQLYAFSGGTAAVAQLYTPTERSLEAAFLQFAS